MAKHSFDLGDVVTIFQMSARKGLLNEGMATIVKIISDADEYYMVKFDDTEDCEPYARFVDVQGQNDPDGYCWDFNKKIGKTG